MGHDFDRAEQGPAAGQGGAAEELHRGRGPGGHPHAVWRLPGRLDEIFDAPLHHPALLNFLRQLDAAVDVGAHGVNALGAPAQDELLEQDGLGQETNVGVLPAFDLDAHEGRIFEEGHARAEGDGAAAGRIGHQGGFRSGKKDAVSFGKTRGGIQGLAAPVNLGAGGHARVLQIARVFAVQAGGADPEARLPPERVAVKRLNAQRRDGVERLRLGRKR